MLEFLRLENCKVTNSYTIATFINMFKSIGTIQCLWLARIKLLNSVVSDLADTIKNNSHLVELHLNNNNLQSSAVVILQALKENSNLKKLNLNSNNMSDKVVDDLADVIRNNTCLEELHLYDNNLQSSAVVILHASFKGKFKS